MTIRNLKKKLFDVTDIEEIQRLDVSTGSNNYIDFDYKIEMKDKSTVEGKIFVNKENGKWIFEAEGLDETFIRFILNSWFDRSI